MLINQLQEFFRPMTRKRKILTRNSIWEFEKNSFETMNFEGFISEKSPSNIAIGGSIGAIIQNPQLYITAEIDIVVWDIIETNGKNYEVKNIMEMFDGNILDHKICELLLVC